MDVDLLDPTTRMREMFIKLPDDVVNTYAHLNYHFNCPEYAQDVYCYLQSIERQFSFGDDYLSSDREVTPQMRPILTDWLIQVFKYTRNFVSRLYILPWHLFYRF